MVVLAELARDGGRGLAAGWLTRLCRAGPGRSRERVACGVMQMSSGAVALVLAAFLASAVEAVEALTIVLAVGVTRGWRSTLIGVGASVAALAVLILLVGPR